MLINIVHIYLIVHAFLPLFRTLLIPLYMVEYYVFPQRWMRGTLQEGDMPLSELWLPLQVLLAFRQANLPIKFVDHYNDTGLSYSLLLENVPSILLYFSTNCLTVS